MYLRFIQVFSQINYDVQKEMKNFWLVLIKIYQYLISPVLPCACRFTPSCSNYSAEAIEKYGATKGMYLTLKRILKCHPFHPGGYDSVN